MEELAGAHDSPWMQPGRGKTTMASGLTDATAMHHGKREKPLPGVQTVHTPSNRGTLTWCREKLYRPFIEPLVLSRNPPWFDARGVAMGLFIGLLIPVGGQIVSLSLLRVLFRFNYLASLAFSLVSNPINMIPLYYGYYLLGCVILGSSVSVSFETFQVLMNPILDRTYFWEAICAFMQLSGEILVRWFVSAVFLSVVFGTVGYVITLKMQTKRLREAAARLGEDYERLLDELEQSVGSTKGSSPGH